MASPENQFSCDKCNKKFTVKRYLTKHLARMHNSNTPPAKSPKLALPCGLCDKVFDRLSHLQRHQMSHAEIREFACSYCGQAFIQKAHLAKHISRKHSKESAADNSIPNSPNGEMPSTTPSDGDNVLPSTSGQHIDHQFPSMVLHVCRSCGYAFTEKYLLHRHVQTVHQPYICGCCKKVFHGKTQLTAHERKTRRESHVCLCGMSFDKISVYKNHTMACTKKCAFECVEDGCGETFAQRVQIDRHWLKKHYTPTMCQFCDFRASAPLRMSEHVAVSHQREICGYCGVHYPPPDHVAETHWRRLKHAKNKLPSKAPRTSEEKDVAAILSGFSTATTNVNPNDQEDIYGEYVKDEKPTDTDDDLLGSTRFPATSLDSLDLLQAFPADVALASNYDIQGLATSTLLTEHPDDANDSANSEKSEDDDENEEIVLQLTVTLTDGDTKLDLGRRLPPKIVEIFPELSFLELRLLDHFPGTGRVLSLNLPVKKPPNMNKEDINQMLKTINL